MSTHPFPPTRHRSVSVQGIDVFWRETEPRFAEAAAPPVLLLHGFPSASHQYRRLMDALGNRYRMVAPDYPGFGHSAVPEPASLGGRFEYSFENLAAVMDGFVEAIGLTEFVLYMFDFGAPIGMRLAQRRPDSIRGLIVQNGNIYEEGLSAEAKAFIGLERGADGAAEAVLKLLTLEGTRWQYEAGTADPELVAPDGWTLDQHFLDLPGRRQPQIDLLFDYKRNVALYAEWQAWLRRNRPPALVAWGGNDPFFSAPGAHAYRRDLPDADIHVLRSGHFALEDSLPEIAGLIDAFMQRVKLRHVVEAAS